MQNNKLPKWFSTSRVYFIIPIAVEFVSFDMKFIEFVIADLATFFVLFLIQPRMNL